MFKQVYPSDEDCPDDPPISPLAMDDVNDEKFKYE